MSVYVALALGGIPLGVMYALTALGIVVIYKTSRVFNFATGAIGLASAYLASSLAGAGVPFPVWVTLSVSLGVLLGIGIELSVRPVKSTLTKTIVTLGWLLFLQGAVGRIYGTQAGERPAGGPRPAESCCSPPGPTCSAATRQRSSSSPRRSSPGSRPSSASRRWAPRPARSPRLPTPPGCSASASTG